MYILRGFYHHTPITPVCRVYQVWCTSPAGSVAPCPSPRVAVTLWPAACTHPAAAGSGGWTLHRDRGIYQICNNIQEIWENYH